MGPVLREWSAVSGPILAEWLRRAGAPGTAVGCGFVARDFQRSGSSAGQGRAPGGALPDGLPQTIRPWRCVPIAPSRNAPPWTVRMALANDELFFAAASAARRDGITSRFIVLGPERARKWLAVDLASPSGRRPSRASTLTWPDIPLPDRGAPQSPARATLRNEDHFCAIIDLWPRLLVPIYATPFSAALLRPRAVGAGRARDSVQVARLGSRLTIGPFERRVRVDVAFYPESNGLNHPLPASHRLPHRRLEARSPPGSGREPRRPAARRSRSAASLSSAHRPMRCARALAVGNVCFKVPARPDGCVAGRVAVTTFRVEISRAALAPRTPQKPATARVVVVGRAMGASSGWRARPAIVEGVQEFRCTDTYGYLPPDKVVALCTRRSQGGSARRSSPQIATDSNPTSPCRRATASLSSLRFPGNEKASAHVTPVDHQGIEVITDPPSGACLRHPPPGRDGGQYSWVKRTSFAGALRGSALFSTRRSPARSKSGISAGPDLPQWHW